MLNSVPDHCGVVCFNEKIVQEFGSRRFCSTLCKL